MSGNAKTKKLKSEKTMFGKTVRHYEITEKLGSGGMGNVYKARDTKLNRFVALKFLLPHLSQTEDAKKRFIQEAKAASALDHPNICTIYEIDETDDGQMFIAMACYSGETLKEKIKNGPLPIDEAVNIAMQIGEGLHKAHSKEIVHRDIKSANILITEDNRVKIVDFGLAKLTDLSMNTSEDTTLGTVPYMSPEQTEGPNVDHRTDIWALGVILYVMLTGEYPFPGEYRDAVIYSIRNDDPKPVRKINSSVSEELEMVVFQMLEKKPEDRYQTLAEFLEDLMNISEGLKPAKVRKGTSAIKLAVLPFTNLTGDPDQDYLSDGFTQEMISQLGRLHPENLSVIARSSVMRYKEGDIPIDQIGRELKVDYVMEGSTRRDVKNIRISADLIQVKDQIQIWGDTFERQFADILALQSDVAKNVARALSLKLLPAEQARLASVRQVNPEAYEAYLKGISYAYRLNPQDIEVGMHYFESALEKDQDFALAHTGVANVWCLRQVMGMLPPSETTPLFRAAAQRALDLDSTLAEVHLVCAFVKWFDWDWEGAEEAFKRAIEINPNYPDARAQYSQLLAILKRPEEAIVQAQKAIELDPFNPVITGLYGSTFAMVGQHDEAMTMAHKELRMSPNSSIGLQILWWGHHYKGEYDQAFEGAKAFYTAMDLASIVQIIEQGYETGGYFEAMRGAAEAMSLASQEHYIQPYWLAILYAVAGEKEKCLDWLEKGYETKDPMHAYITELELRGFIHDESRYQDLLRKMNFPSGK